MTLRREPKQARGERRIGLILDTAAQVFDEVGFDAANTIMIAARANTSVGALYGFFPNKEAIADALGARITDELRALADGLISPELLTLPLDDALNRLIAPLVAFIHKRPGFRALFLHAPRFGAQNAAQQRFQAMVTERLAALLMLRYPGHDTALVGRVTQVCFENVKLLTGLAILRRRVDRALLDELRLLLRVYIETRLGQPPAR